MSAIILDGHLKSALACVRSLGAKNIHVVCGAERQSAMACHSKYVQKRFVCVSPKIDQDEFIKRIIEEAKKLKTQDGQKPVVFCFSDATMCTLVQNLELLNDFGVTVFPSLESVEIASDKAKTYELAQRLCIPTITTYKQDSLDEIVYPAVVKNRHSVVWREGKGVSGSAQFVFSKEELLSQYLKVEREAGEAPLVQEFVQGDEYGVEMVCDQGQTCATFVHKRIRSLSPRGGAAVVKETAKETEEVHLMRQYANALVRELTWHGPVMIEFKINSTNGQVLLMEINGRFWGSLPLPVRAGVDFPMMVYQLGVEDTVAKMPLAFLPPYLRTRHFLADCKWLLAVWFKNDKLRALLYPSRFRALYDFKKEIFISKGDVFMWNDIKPSIMEYVDLLKK